MAKSTQAAVQEKLRNSLQDDDEAVVQELLCSIEARIKDLVEGWRQKILDVKEG